MSSRYNITIQQGTTLSLRLVWQDQDNVPINLTGYTARMQIRPDYASHVITEQLTSATGEITFEAVNGVIMINLSAERTARIPVALDSKSKPPRSLYVYDLELESSAGVVKRLIHGDVIVIAEVTRNLRS